MTSPKRFSKPFRAKPGILLVLAEAATAAVTPVTPVSSVLLIEGGGGDACAGYKPAQVINEAHHKILGEDLTLYFFDIRISHVPYDAAVLIQQVEHRQA